MENQLISFETAKLAKEKGFREFCCYAYTNDGKYMYGNEIGFYWKSYTISPTQSLLQRWLREKHNIFMKNINVYKLEDLYGKTYEEVLEVDLQEALLLIKIKTE